MVQFVRPSLDVGEHIGDPGQVLEILAAAVPCRCRVRQLKSELYSMSAAQLFLPQYAHHAAEARIDPRLMLPPDPPDANGVWSLDLSSRLPESGDEADAKGRIVRRFAVLMASLLLALPLSVAVVQSAQAAAAALTVTAIAPKSGPIAG